MTLKTYSELHYCRYVKGRPRLLDTELPRIKFLEDRSGCENMMLSSKFPQQKISNNCQYQIETEIKSLPDLCQLLESVLTARDFLMEAGGQPEMSLSKSLVSIILCSYQDCHTSFMTGCPSFV